MTNEELLEKELTGKQLAWLAKHGKKVSGTQNEMLADLARQLFEAGVYDDKEQKAKLQTIIVRPGLTYDLGSFAEKAGIQDEKVGDKVTRSSSDILMADWDKVSPSQREIWGTGIENAYGPGSIDALRTVMAVEGRNREYAKKQPKVGTAGKILGTFFAPRSLEAIQSGKASGWGDALLSKNGLLDLGENAIMALPFAGYAGMAAKASRIPKAAKVAAAVLGAAAAPAAVEGMDKLAYDPEENPDRSMFSWGDVGLGTATNIAAPWLLGRGARRMGRLLGTRGEDGKAAAGLSDEVLDILDDAVKKGEWVKPSKESVNAVSTIMNTEAKEAAAAAKGATKLQDATTKEIEATRLLNKWPEKAEEGTVSFLNGDHWKMKHDFDKATKLYDEAGKLRKEAGNLDYWTKKQAERAMKDAPQNKARDYLLAGMLEKRAQDIEKKKGLDNGMSTSAGLLLEGAKSSDKVHAQVKDILDFSKELQNADLSDMWRYKNPELYKAMEMGENWLVNKYGSKRDADMFTGQASRMLGAIDPKLNISDQLAKAKKKDVEEVRKNIKKSQASRILGQQDLSDEDREWVKKISENPGIVEGYGEGSSSKFKNWYLLRGQDILRGTDIFRPTPAVE